MKALDDKKKNLPMIGPPAPADEEDLPKTTTDPEPNLSAAKLRAEEA